MPLIRYAIGDVGAADPSSGRACPCGRGFDRMGSIQGRDTDIVVTPSGNRLIVHFFTGLLEHFQEIDTFQVVQEEPSAILLRVVPAVGFDRFHEGGCAERIVQTLRAKGAGELNITVEPVPEIPLPPTGKRRFVISKIAQETLTADRQQPTADGGQH
jgi:phenylacetate-CoA ligase